MGEPQRALPAISGNGEHATVSLADYLLAVRAGDIAVQAERDRRYAEVGAEREKALKIKEAADETALTLAREIQHYRDEQANNLRAQIERERGDYATQSDLQGVAAKMEALIKPLTEFVAGARRVDTVKRLDAAQLVQVLALLAVAAGVIFAIISHHAG